MAPRSIADSVGFGALRHPPPHTPPPNLGGFGSFVTSLNLAGEALSRPELYLFAKRSCLARLVARLTFNPWIDEV